MSERTNEFFRTPLLNAIVICFINPVRGEYLGDRSWYVEGKVVFADKTRAIVNWKGYKTEFVVKGCSYHNITNKSAPIDRFLNFARTLPGARHVNFYDAQGRKPRAFLFQKVL
jgi:hypothetical protein